MPPKLPSPLASSPKPVTRAQSDDKVASLRIPTPEELGLGAPVSPTRERGAVDPLSRVELTDAPKLLSGHEPLDWTMVERKLDAAGVTAFHVEKTAGGFHFVCRLPKGEVTGRGATRVEAIRQALAQLPN
jgi:hypothetical protein